MADPYTSTAWTFGGTKRQPEFMKKIAIPGPGTYELHGKGIVSVSQPMYSIGTGNREPIKAKHFVPGPGNYEMGGEKN